VSRFRVVPATAERWPDLVDLFERKGPRGGHRNTPGYGFDDERVAACLAAWREGGVELTTADETIAALA
jgi:hypothetical protein